MFFFVFFFNRFFLFFFFLKSRIGWGGGSGGRRIISKLTGGNTEYVSHFCLRFVWRKRSVSNGWMYLS